MHRPHYYHFAFPQLAGRRVFAGTPFVPISLHSLGHEKHKSAWSVRFGLIKFEAIVCDRKKLVLDRLTSKQSRLSPRCDRPEKADYEDVHVVHDRFPVYIISDSLSVLLIIQTTGLLLFIRFILSQVSKVFGLNNIYDIEKRNLTLRSKTTNVTRSQYLPLCL